jgi:hypothetical protein
MVIEGIAGLVEGSRTGYGPAAAPQSMAIRYTQEDKDAPISDLLRKAMTQREIEVIVGADGNAADYVGQRCAKKDRKQGTRKGRRRAAPQRVGKV